jgi:hypothetical protein
MPKNINDIKSKRKHAKILLRSQSIGTLCNEMLKAFISAVGRKPAGDFQELQEKKKFEVENTLVMNI